MDYRVELDIYNGPMDLLLYLIKRDELDIYNIPITKITNDFLEYIHHMESLNIELASEFILFISTLMRIKARMILPRKEVDEQGNEIDPRQELVDKNYPSPTQSHYLVIRLAPVPEPELHHLQWHFKDLPNYTSGRASAVPFTATLAQFMKVVQGRE